MTNKYNDSKIYKICSSCTNDVYIGSTYDKTLARRMAQHKGNYRQFQNGKYHYVSSFEIIKYNDAHIVLIESYNCSNRDELRAREEYWRKQFPNAINDRRCFRSTEDDKNDRKIISKKTYQRNKDTILQKQKQYRENNVELIKKRKKEYAEKNKDKIKAHYSEKIFCDTCCLIGRKGDLARHEKTKNHLKYKQLQNQIAKTQQDYETLMKSQSIVGDGFS